ncbi:transferrin-binding protein-like solute binding protein [Chelonobacter oris]|nr:transferrin-binding protein-like solute binding protein [Chelonobacter oris]
MKNIAPLNGAFFGSSAEEVAGEAHNGKWGVVFAAGKQ